MQFTEVPWDVTCTTPRNTHPRSEGVHVSQIIGDLYKTIYPDRFSDDGPLPWEKFMAGWAWEEVIGRAMADVQDTSIIQQFGELEEDNIFGTPDAWNQAQDCIEEYKCTWVSARHDIGSDKFSHWLMQGKAYLWMSSMDTIIYRVFFVNGDYSYLQKGNTRQSHPVGPQTKAWVITYEPEELKRNWDILVKHAKKKGWI
jgi:hypothetical protein